MLVVRTISLRQWVSDLVGAVREGVRRAVGSANTSNYTVRGFRVTVENSRPDIATPFVLGRLEAALALIETYQPSRFRHLRRDVAQFWVTSYPCRGAYLPAQQTVMTELSFLARQSEFSLAEVAASILHEGIHARVHQMRIRLGFGTLPHDRSKEERLCRRAELAFGIALPPALGRPVVARATESLALADDQVAPDVDWAAAHAAKSEADRQAVDAWRRSIGQ